MSRSISFVPRRSFLGRAALAVAALPRLLKGESVPDMQGQANPDAFLAGLTGSHRILFNLPEMGAGAAQIRALNFLNTYNTAFGVPDSDINVIVTYWSYSTLLAVNDAMWEKHRLGELMDEKDSSGAYWTRNPWRTAAHFAGRQAAAAGTEALQRRGVRFIVCSNALGFWIGQIAAARSLDAAAVNTEIRANLLPGVVPVPAAVIAFERAQKNGFAYHRE